MNTFLNTANLRIFKDKLSVTAATNLTATTLYADSLISELRHVQAQKHSEHATNKGSLDEEIIDISLLEYLQGDY